MTFVIFLFSRALFEKDKLVFSFMLCIEIMKQEGEVTTDEWNFFLRGAAGMDKERPPKPDVDWIQITAWKALVDINDAITVFRGIHNDMMKTPCWVHLGDLEVSSAPRHSRYFILSVLDVIGK